MVPNSKNPARFGGAAGPSNASSWRADCSTHTLPNPAPQTNSHVARRRRLVTHLRRLGPAPLGHFISDIERGGDIDATLEAYGRLPVEFVLAYGGDRFAGPMLRAIDGGARAVSGASKSIRDTGASRKGRPPIGKKAMTPAERQRRRRKKLAKKKSHAIAKKLGLQKRAKLAALYNPVPPGITYWRYRRVRLADGTLSHIPWAETKPLAACRQDLDAGDIFALIRRLSTIARDRGILDGAREAFEAGTVSAKDAIDSSNYAAGLVVFRDETGSPKGGWTCWGYEAWLGQGPKPVSESPRIPVTEEIEELVDVALARVLDPGVAITEDIKDRFDIILNEMDGPNRDIAAVNLEWLKQGCPPSPPEPSSAPEPVVLVTSEIAAVAATVLDRQDYCCFAQEVHELRGHISVSSLEFLKEQANDANIVPPACHETGGTMAKAVAP
jgi:hypothetical protein